MLMRKLMTLVTVMMMTIIATRPVVKSSASSTTVDGQNPALPILRNIP